MFDCEKVLLRGAIVKATGFAGGMLTDNSVVLEGFVRECHGRVEAISVPTDINHISSCK